MVTVAHLEQEVLFHNLAADQGIRARKGLHVDKDVEELREEFHQLSLHLFFLLLMGEEGIDEGTRIIDLENGALSV